MNTRKKLELLIKQSEIVTAEIDKLIVIIRDADRKLEEI